MQLAWRQLGTTQLHTNVRSESPKVEGAPLGDRSALAGGLRMENNIAKDVVIFKFSFLFLLWPD